MIIEFSVGNYRSFNEIQTVNFRATGLVSEDKAIDENNIAIIDGQRLLKTVGVYGANASGKSNLVKALEFFKNMVKYSLKNEELLLGDSYEPNILFTNKDHDGYFQIVMVIGGKKYRYGFAIKERKIISEWLFGPAEKNGTYYFTRENREIEINKEYFKEGIDTPYKDNLRSNTLFLTFCSSYNGSISGQIRDFISNKIEFRYDRYSYVETNKLIVEENKADLVLDWLSIAGLNFNTVSIENNVLMRDSRPEYFGFESRHNEVVFLEKNSYDEKGNVIGKAVMNLDKQESQGTQKYYSYIGLFYELFHNGGILVSDEIDSNLHPALLRKIISMFNNPNINKANAQLLCTSHDTNLMSPDIMRRDQFYFTEKSMKDETILYSLSDLKGIRNNADFAKQYLAGFYGALPVLGNFMDEEHSSNDNPETAR